MSLNCTARIAYDDLRGWLSEAKRLGEVRVVRGANWQEDIGLAAEAVLRAENGPCVVSPSRRDRQSQRTSGCSPCARDRTGVPGVNGQDAFRGAPPIPRSANAGSGCCL
jgi:hypothetical protein